MKLILASGSPRRIKFLTELGLDFQVIPSGEDEKADETLPIDERIKAIALSKAESVFKNHSDCAVLAADSVVFFCGEVIGKPKDEADAVRILKKLSGKNHEVKTAFAFISDGFFYNEIITTQVLFNELSSEFINEYVKTGSPLDKAGAYGIQDGNIVKSYNGSYTNVIGLPMERITALLKAENFLS